MSIYFPKRSLGSLFWSMLNDDRQHCYFKTRDELLPFVVALFLSELITPATLMKFTPVMEYLKEYEGAFFETEKRKYSLSFCWDELMKMVLRILEQDKILGKKIAACGSDVKKVLKYYLEDFKFSYGLNGSVCVALMDDVLAGRVACYHGETLQFQEIEKENGKEYVVLYEVELNNVKKYRWDKKDAQVVWKRRIGA